MFAALDGAIFATESSPFDHPRPVIALHGWGRSRSDMAGLLDLGGVVAVDLPGHGASPPPDEAGGARWYADRLAAALDERSTPPAIVVGHSFGGRVAVCLAARRPDLVAALVISGVPLLRSENAGRPVGAVRRAKALNRWGLLSDRRLDAVRQRHGSADYRAADGIMREVLVRTVNEDYGDELAQVICPVTMVWADGDTAAGVEVARRAATLIGSDVELVIVAGDHFSVITDPAPLRRAVIDHREHR